MKWFSILLVFFIYLEAYADSNSQFIEDGTTLQLAQRQLAENIEGDHLVITDYIKSWYSFNPLIRDYKYRTISFEFLNKAGKKQSYTCDLRVIKGEPDLTAFNCNGGDKSFRYYHKLNNFGYDVDSIVAENVFNNFSSEEIRGTSQKKAPTSK